MKARTTRAGASAAGILLAAALLVGINYLGARHWGRLDWTKTRLYSLSETTKKTVRGLTRPVRIMVFMTGQSRLNAPIRELLARYRALSPRIEVEYLDPTRSPVRAQAVARDLGGVRLNTIVFRSGDRTKHVEEDKLAEYDYGAMGMPGAAPNIKAFKGEEAFTSALLAVTETRPPKIYFTTGHGEATLDSFERGQGFADLKGLLERDNITVASWESLGKGSVPADADAVVVAGPRTRFLEPETAALEKYLAAGGNVLFLLDPVFPAPGAPPPDYGLGRILNAQGVRLGADIVVDPGNALPLVGAETFLANRFGSHPIVRSLSEQRLPVVFRVARSVARVEPAPQGSTVTMLVETTADGWGETGLDRLDERVEKDDRDNAGPVALAFAVAPDEEASGASTPAASSSKPTPKTGKVVVIGNSQFAMNGSLNDAGNANLFLNAIHWLTGAEKRIGIAPKTPEQASLSLSQSQVRRIGLFTTLGMPALAVLLGVWVWYRRRD